MDIPVWSNLLHGFGIVSSLQNLSWLFVGVLLGTIVGVMPGLGSLSTMAILLPITFGMDPVAAVIMLVGIHYGSSYGGSTMAASRASIRRAMAGRMRMMTTVTSWCCKK